MSIQIIESLKNRLKEFGLNPKAWKIKILDHHQFLITSINDSEFSLKGYTKNKNGKPEWARLEIYSI